jgi:hypothetical protein
LALLIQLLPTKSTSVVRLYLLLGAQAVHQQADEPVGTGPPFR